MDRCVEVKKRFFILFRVQSGGNVPVFGQFEENKNSKVKPSYLMVKAGTWGEDAAQLHRFFGWNNIGVSFMVPFSVKAEDCYCTESEMRGHVKVENAEAHPEWMCQNGEMSWNLKIDKKVAFNVGYGAGRLFRQKLGQGFYIALGVAFI